MFTLPLIDDLHVHLRQAQMMKSVVPSIAKGGVGRVLVMPNLSPPIITVEAAKKYREELQSIDPNIEYFMTLFLAPSITVEDLRRARAEANVVGVKSYPRGVTTGSESGVESYETYYNLFAEMEKLGMSLHFHGEVPDRCVMKAEEEFLTNLFKIHSDFPNLKIVLEHVTTEAAINAVLACGPTVAATITVHHIDLTISDVVGNNVNFCKPVAKLESDRDAIRRAILSGNPKFFFGSDSAPHLLTKKQNHCGCPAGIFTQPSIAQYLADAFDRLGCLDKLEKFACEYGAKFLQLPPRPHPEKTITLQRVPYAVPATFIVEGEGEIYPFRAGQESLYSLI
jgi:dihydroorotase